MKKIDLIIEALEEIQSSGILKEQPWSKWVQALAAARELRDMKPVAWMYHDGSSPTAVPSDLMGTIVFSHKRIRSYKNERPLYALQGMK